MVGFGEVLVDAGGDRGVGGEAGDGWGGRGCGLGGCGVVHFFVGVLMDGVRAAAVS